MSLAMKFFVLFQRTNKLDYPRLGIVTYKKKFPTAIMRNELKRQVRESFRIHRPLLKGYDIVVLARTNAANASKTELRQCLDDLFQEFLKSSTRS